MIETKVPTHQRLRVFSRLLTHTTYTLPQLEGAGNIKEGMSMLRN